MSLWHWLVIALVVLGVGSVYRFSKRKVHANVTAPTGVGGWLLLLVAGLLVLGPMLGAARVNADLISAESQYPTLRNLAQWGTFKSATWWTFLAIAAASVYGGWGLARSRKYSAVKRAKWILWLTGPVGALVMGLGIPLSTFGQADPSDSQFIESLISSTALATLWTAYLSKSRRVQATYAKNA